MLGWSSDCPTVWWSKKFYDRLGQWVDGLVSGHFKLLMKSKILYNFIKKVNLQVFENQLIFGKKFWIVCLIWWTRYWPTFFFFNSVAFTSIYKIQHFPCSLFFFCDKIKLILDPPGPYWTTLFHRRDLHTCVLTYSTYKSVSTNRCPWTNAGFSRNQNAHYAGNMCIYFWTIFHPPNCFSCSK